MAFFFKSRKTAFIIFNLVSLVSFSQNISIDEAWALKDKQHEKAMKELNLSLLKFRKSNNHQLEAKTLSYIGVIEDIQGFR